MTEPLKASLVNTLIIVLIVVFAVAMVRTKVFGLLDILIVAPSFIEAGDYVEDERLGGILFLSVFDTEISQMRIERLLLDGGSTVTTLFAGAGGHTYGLERNGEVYSTIEVNHKQKESELVLRNGVTIVERVRIANTYIMESALSPDASEVALVVSTNELELPLRNANTDSKIIIYNFSTKEYRDVGKGVAPMWNAEGTYLAYVTHEGVMMYDIKNQVEQLGIDSPNPALTYGMAAISANGKNIALVTDESTRIKVYTLLDWVTFTTDVEVESIGISAATLAMPFFSPKGRYLTYVASMKEGEKSLKVYDRLKSREVQIEVEEVPAIEITAVDEWVVAK